MKNLKFKEVTASYEDADGDEHESTVRAAVVTDDLAMIDFTNDEGVQARRRREVTDRGGNAVRLNVGDVVVETEKPGVYDVHSADAWKSTGYAASPDAAPESTPARAAPSAPDTRPPAPASNDVMQAPEHDAQPADTAQPLGERPTDAAPTE